MIRLAFLLLFLPTAALAQGFTGDGFGIWGFFQGVVTPIPAASGLTQPVFATTILPSSGSATQIGGGGGTVNQTLTTTNVRRIALPYAGTIKGLYANLGAVQTGAHLVDTLNGTSGTLGCAFTPASSPFACTDSTHADAAAPGTLLSWQWSLSAGTWTQGIPPAVATYTSLAYEYQAATGQQGMLVSLPSGAGFSTVAAQYVGFGQGGQASVTGSDANASSIMPTAGTVHALYVIPNGTENTVPHVYKINHNGSAVSTVTCTPGVSTTTGCCVNDYATPGKIGPGGPACTAMTAFTFSAGDTLSAEIDCPGATTCAAVFPGITLAYTPTTSGLAILTAQSQASGSAGVNGFIGFNDNSFQVLQTNYQTAPQVGASTLTFANLIACTVAAVPAASSRTISSLLATTPGTTPATAQSTTVTLVPASVLCGGTPPVGVQDTTDSWTAGSGYSLSNQLASTGTVVGAVYKIGMTAAISP